MSGRDAVVDELVTAFGALLDDSVILAISSERDLKDPGAVSEVRDILRILAENVPAEESTFFERRSLSEGRPGTVSVTHSNIATNVSSSSTSTSSRARSTATSAPCWLGAPTYSAVLKQDGDGEGVVNDSSVNRDKLSPLRDMFTGLREADLSFALEKAGGNVSLAIDDLLNMQYLESNGKLPRGIDGFVQRGNSGNYTKQQRKKRKKEKYTSNGEASSSPRKSHIGDEDTIRHDDIVYISERLNLHFTEAARVYDDAAQSRTTAIVAMIDRYVAQEVLACDEAGKASAHRLSQAHRGLQASHASAIVQVAGAIPSWMEELAGTVARHHTSSTAVRPKVTTPLPDDDGSPATDAEFIPVTSKRRKPPRFQAVEEEGPAANGLPLAINAADRSRALYTASYDSAVTAADLRRRGGPRSMWRQVAGVYAERSREQAQLAREAASVAADELVASRGTESRVDLHGVSVDDGVRIAVERVGEWWDSGRHGDNNGLIVVTGRGKHSSNGVPHLRQAVMAALARDGWIFAAEAGHLSVTDRRR